MSNIDLTPAPEPVPDLVGKAAGFIPRGKTGEVIAHVYKVVVTSIAQERQASRLVVPALTTETEVKRRMKLCFGAIAVMMDRNGLNCSYTFTMDHLAMALWHEVHGGQWVDKLVPSRTYNADAPAEYGAKMMAS
jgi:hypothetical protein